MKLSDEIRTGFFCVNSILFAIFLFVNFALIKAGQATDLNETNITTHVAAQSQATNAILSGVEQVERSCIFPQKNTSLPDQLSALSIEIEKDFKVIHSNRKKEKQSALIMVDLAKQYKSNSCNLFSSLLDTSNSSSECGYAQRATTHSDLFLSSVLKLQSIDLKLENTFKRIIDLEAVQCMSPGISKNLYLKHKKFLETIGGGGAQNLNSRIEVYTGELKEKLK